jgi:hypothetical protein
VAQAVEFEGEWPVISGISGNTVAISHIIKMGEQIRGTNNARYTQSMVGFLIRH